MTLNSVPTLLKSVEYVGRLSWGPEVGIVPKSVPSESLLNSNRLRHLTNIFPQDRPDRSSTSVALARKNPVVGLRVAGASLPVQQGFRENWMNGYGPLRRLGLARTDYSIHDRPGGVPDLAFRLVVKEPLMVILPSDHRLAGLKRSVREI